MARVPAAPGNPQIARSGDDVYVWFTVPAANVAGGAPADADAVELYAVTATTPPAGPDLTTSAVKIATYPVHPVIPPPPPLPEGAPPLPALPAPKGFTQGATAVVRERLTPETRQPTVLPTPPLTPAATDITEADEEEEPLPGPLVAPPSFSTLRRYYFLRAVGPRNRISATTALLSVPIDDASEPPAAVKVTYTESAMTLEWTASPDAHPAPPAPDPALLPSKPLVAPVAATGYHVFEMTPGDTPAEDPYAIPLPASLTSDPIGTLSFAIPGAVTFGRERCFVVRATDVVGDTLTLGLPSAPACVTPVDTFPPAAPARLEAIAGVNVINLIWEPNTEPDLAGYVVLRGTPGGALQALTPQPIRETTYRDQTATPGVRYVYAVVAVDTATPQNISPQSNRVEESSRTP
ncbi:MAG: hypothetical protein IT178_06270 [Acidobacteria bacterium]|nr:hypothetical protein [Acidobacteriota bacterium]